MCWQGDPREDPGFLRFGSLLLAKIAWVGYYTYCFVASSGFLDAVHLRCSLDRVHGERTIDMLQLLLLRSLDLLGS